MPGIATSEEERLVCDKGTGTGGCRGTPIGHEVAMRKYTTEDNHGFSLDGCTQEDRQEAISCDQKLDGHCGWLRIVGVTFTAGK